MRTDEIGLFEDWMTGYLIAGQAREILMDLKLSVGVEEEQRQTQSDTTTVEPNHFRLFIR